MILHWLLFKTLFFLLHTARSFDPQFENCRPTTCGKHNISYPFWIDDQPSYCGYPGFHVTCRNQNGPYLDLSEDNAYHISDIFYHNNSISLLSTESSSTETCPVSLHNLTLDRTPLYLTRATHNLSLFFNCTVNPPSTFRPISSCLTNNKTRNSYYSLSTINEETVMKFSRTCGSIVIAPVPSREPSVSADLDPTVFLRRGLVLGWIAPNCRDYHESGGRCGYNETSPQFFCFCSNRPRLKVCSSHPAPKIQDEKKGRSRSTLQIIIGITIAVAGLLLFCLLAFFSKIIFSRRQFLPYNSIFFWKKKANEACNVEVFLRECGSLAPRRYSYSELRKMTNSFKEKLGQGGYGAVFKGRLPGGCLVAVKVLSESKGNGEEFTNEVASIGRTYHINVVRLLGFCVYRSKRALVYEFMPNGSLEKFIYSDKPRKTPPLGWEKLHQIMIGIARGLEYLHRGCHMRILHFDIKPHNILLDEDFCPKISDFGLAKLCPGKDSIISMTGARGTAGYIAPEVFSRNFGGVSHKSDVYSFGMMTLEMVGGRENIDPAVENTSEIYFPQWIYKRLDLRRNLGVFGTNTDEEERTAKQMIMVGLWCIQTNPANRPSMSTVVDMLEGSLESLEMPPKPFLSSPTRSSEDTCTELQSISEEIS